MVQIDVKSCWIKIPTKSFLAHVAPFLEAGGYDVYVERGRSTVLKKRSYMMTAKLFRAKYQQCSLETVLIAFGNTLKAPVVISTDMLK